MRISKIWNSKKCRSPFPSFTSWSATEDREIRSLNTNELREKTSFLQRTSVWSNRNRVICKKNIQNQQYLLQLPWISHERQLPWSPFPHFSLTCLAQWFPPATHLHIASPLLMRVELRSMRSGPCNRVIISPLSYHCQIITFLAHNNENYYVRNTDNSFFMSVCWSDWREIKRHCLRTFHECRLACHRAIAWMLSILLLRSSNWHATSFIARTAHESECRSAWPTGVTWEELIRIPYVQ